MMIGLKPGEVAYTALPLYHTFASQVGVTGAVIAGGAVAVAPKFRTVLLSFDRFESIFAKLLKARLTFGKIV